MGKGEGGVLVSVPLAADRAGNSLRDENWETKCAGGGGGKGKRH